MICSWCSCLFARDFLIFWLGLGGLTRSVNCVSVDLRGFWPDWSGILTNKNSFFFHTNPTENNAHFSGRSDVSRQGLRSTTAGQQPGAKRQVWVGGCLGEIWIWKLRKLGENNRSHGGSPSFGWFISWRIRESYDGWWYRGTPIYSEVESSVLFLGSWKPDIADSL